MSIVKKILAALVAVYQSEPAVVIGVVVAGVVAVATSLGIVVDQASVQSVVAYVLSILFGAVAIRSQVTPSK